MDEKYFVYVIKCEDDKKYYVGKSTSKTKWYNPCKYFLSKYEKDNSIYSEIGASIKNKGIKSHKVCILYDRDLFPIEEAEHRVYKLVKKLEKKNKSLNGEIVNPERGTCKECGKRIKKVFMEDHLQKYCEKQLRDEFDEIIFDVE